MDWTNIIPGTILGFREGMEAFLIIAVMLEYLNKIGRQEMKKPVKLGLAIGILGSLVFGAILLGVVNLFQANSDAVAKLWESGASIVGLILLSTFIYWMIKHGSTIVAEVESDVAKNLSKGALILLSSVMVLREGAEIVLFAFSSLDQQLYVLGVFIGVLIAAVLAILMYKALIKVNLSIIFKVTLIYLILQAAYLLGYGIHEFLSALKTLEIISGDSFIFAKAYNLAGTILDHKQGLLGLPLNILIGWYSKPEWIQFIVQLSYLAAMSLFWKKLKK